MEVIYRWYQIQPKHKKTRISKAVSYFAPHKSMFNKQNTLVISPLQSKNRKKMEFLVYYAYGCANYFRTKDAFCSGH